MKPVGGIIFGGVLTSEWISAAINRIGGVNYEIERVARIAFGRIAEQLTDYLTVNNDIVEQYS